ncbi:Guanine nucleotide-binding protein subunit gamma, partial [Hypocenomyce scalaris]|nr:Guanine nucleotide-binding protein subunit gamma [Hypocenomyce scalaris]
MAPAYEIRAGGDVKNKKQSMADLKLRRLNELNGRLTEDLNRPRIRVSEASGSLVQYCNSTKDFMVPSIWGQ